MIDPTKYGAVKIDPTSYGAKKLTVNQSGVVPKGHQSIESLKSAEATAKTEANKGMVGRFFRAAPGALWQETGGAVVDSIKSGASQIGEGFKQGANAPSALQGFEGGLKIGAGGVNILFSPLAPFFKNVGRGIDYAGNEIAKSEGVQKFANSKAGEITSRVAEDVSNLTTIAGAVAGSKKLMGDVVTPKLQDKYVNQNIKQWEKPVKVNKPGFNTATEIYKNAETSANPSKIGETLTKNKLNVNDHIENGNYATSDSATQIRTDAGKLSSETLRPSLQRADQYTPKTPVSDVVSATEAKIRSNPKITPGNKIAIIQRLRAEGAALEQQHPQGLSLTDLHDSKITYDFNSKYSPVGDVATNNAATMNKALADSSRSLLESRAPREIPVKEFNAELQKQYQAADYLDAINGKKVPTSIGQRIAKTTSKVVGAAVGNSLGGGILGGVGGYHIGGMIESLFENLPNPVKNQILNNLKVTNPAVFEQVQGFLTAPQPDFPQLSAPSSIQMGPRTYPNTPIEVLPAQKQIYRSKTGQMQAGHTSQTGPIVYPKKSTKLGGK